MTRTPDEIFQDICSTSTTEEQHDLWDELARVVTRDRDAPPWASLAVVLLRDELARELKRYRSGTT